MIRRINHLTLFSALFGGSLLALLGWTLKNREESVPAISATLALSIIVIALCAGASFAFSKARQIAPMLKRSKAARLRLLTWGAVGLSWTAMFMSIIWPPLSYRNLMAGIPYNPGDALRAQVISIAVVAVLTVLIVLYEALLHVRSGRRG